MKLLTSKEMQFLDRITIEKVGISGIVLMENAGKAVADFITERWPPSAKVYIFCGPGNNGGDGLVVARHLFNRRYQVKVFMGVDKEKIKGDAATNYQIACNMGVNIKHVSSLSELPFPQESTGERKPIIVDALLGTGAKGSPRGIIKEMVNVINRCRAIKIAVDIPTGVDADTGEVAGEAVKVNYTITFAYPKRGVYLYPGIDFSGEVKVVDIGIPKDIIEKEKIDIRVELLSSENFSPEIFYRRPSSHKGEFGHLLVLAGSAGMTGAAALACMAALRIGTGLVTLGIPESLNPVMEIKLTEAMTLPLPETKEKTFSLKAMEQIESFQKRCQALVVGPGLSRNSESQELVREILRRFEIPLVLDADGINAIQGKTEIIASYQGPLVITPHPGEMARLVGISVAEVQRDRIKAALNLSKNTGKVVVLKGAGTVIAEPEGKCWVNTTGNPGMASGGVGDVLTGTIGGFLAQRMDVLMAAKLGVYLHGLAGDLAMKTKGQSCLLATDIIENLPFAIRSLKNGYC